MARRIPRPQLALLVLVLAVGIGYGVDAIRSAAHRPGAGLSAAPTGSASVTPSGPGARSIVALSSLPAPAAQTVALIQRGGPYPYAQDGVVFGNYQHLLPSHPSGYYHEYTVPTPGAESRGTRRLITGAGGQYYYTGDHYESFYQVDVSK